MSKIKQLDFQGQTIFCGIDVHKKSWRVNVRNEEFELEDYSQDPCEDLLIEAFEKKIFGRKFYKLAYEAGFSGFELTAFIEVFRDILHGR